MLRLLLLVLPITLHAADSPPQPIPFSHQQHATAFKIACKMCHPNPDPGWTMTVAPASVCMQCHSAIKTESPAIRLLARYAAGKQDIPWQRIYAVPEFVYFSHRVHLNARTACSDCHANVAQAEVVVKDGNISMDACMTCHQMRKTGIGCNFCHDLRRR